MGLDFEPGVFKRDQGVFVGTTPHPHWKEPAPALARFSAPGNRKLDPILGCWVLEPEVFYSVKIPEPTTRPLGDGSKVFWRVAEVTGQTMWVIEAADFDTALVEKRRLCQAVGCRSGEARLYPL